MRRPNPWITTPALVVGLLVGWLGWIATDISCRADRPPGSPGCPVAATAIGVICFVGATVGLIVVLALTSRSIAEYRQERDASPEGPEV
jgi:hypothetical protein